jgi:hypothetical protein
MHVSIAGTLGADVGDFDVVHVPSARHGPLTVQKPIAVVWHWTYSGAEAQRGERDTVALARSIAAPEVVGDDGETVKFGPSWHVAVDRTGVVVQSVAFGRGSFHCRGEHAFAGHRRKPVNEVSIGVELENLGRCVLVDGKWHPVLNPVEPEARWTPDPRFTIPGDDVVLTPDGAYHGFTDAQVVSAERILRALVRWGAPLTAENCALGHRDLDPKRKADPGYFWTQNVLPGILANVFGASVCADGTDRAS